ncbi:MAG: DUF4136 domain-containing protein [Bacteroidia bacterium]|nr:DUF4136 domain-containing protein [Bacteroidia bacterium]
MKFKPAYFPFAVMILFVASCATMYHVYSDYERNIDFTEFKTYKVVNHENGFPVGASPIDKQRIRRAINYEMQAIGYQPSDNPDILVSWFVKIENRKGVNVYRDYYGRWRYRQYLSVYDYKAGTLVVDLIDQNTNDVVWHGKTYESILDRASNREKKIKNVVREIFGQYMADTGVEEIYAAN